MRKCFKKEVKYKQMRTEFYCDHCGKLIATMGTYDDGFLPPPKEDYHVVDTKAEIRDLNDASYYACRFNLAPDGEYKFTELCDECWDKYFKDTKAKLLAAGFVLG